MKYDGLIDSVGCYTRRLRAGVLGDSIDDTTQRARDLPPIVPPKRLLRVVFTPDTEAMGRKFPLEGQTFSIGRGANVDGCIRDGRISREHIRLMPASEPGAYLVKELGSSNGTFLDGARIDPSRPAFLLGGQVLSLGGETLMVVDQEPPPDLLPSSPDASSLAAHEIVGISLFSEALRRSIATVAPAKGAVLVLGETGSGKEVTAHAIHRLSTRAVSPMYDVNCANLQPNLAEADLFGARKGAFSDAQDREGFFDRADGGTLFLDEIGELPEAVQAKLLRTLEDGTVHPLGAASPHRVDVRVIGATNAEIDLQTARFRRDLLARLSVWVLRLLPLVQRRADVLALFDHFVRQRRPSAEPLQLTGEFAEALLLHAWPENARELRNMAERLCTLVPAHTPFDLVHLPERLQQAIRARGVRAAAPSGSGPVAFDPARSTLPPPDLEATVPGKSDLKRPERAVLEAALSEAGGNVSDAARKNGWHVTQLRRWVEYAGIDIEAFRARKKK
jgi:DNA-binding NtrC family response regulator